MEKKANLAHYFRYLWDEPGLIIVRGDAEEIFKGQAAYNARYNIKPADSGKTDDLHKLFAASAMAAVSLVDSESWGWSLSFPNDPIGLFASVEPEGMVCGRVLGSDKKKNIAVVQRQKTGEDMTQSHFLLDSNNVIRSVERYFEESDQGLIRIALDKDKRGVLVRALPGGDFSSIKKYSDEDLIAKVDKLVEEDKLKKMKEMLVFYECRCNDEMILNMITNLPEADRKELWGDLDKLEIECPRCGRSYVVNSYG